MEISLSLEDDPLKESSFFLIKELSAGIVSVYQIYSPQRHANFVLKTFPKTSHGGYLYSKEKLMIKANHPHVIQYFPIKYYHEEFYAILMEYIHYGDFFDIVTSGMLNSEILVRTYFHQLIKGLEYIHSLGIAHLDLKLDNLMLDSNFKLKIIDFDHAQSITDEILTSTGTKGYRAPEVVEKNCKDFVAADMFSVGVILYTFRAKEFPFSEGLDQIEPNLESYSSFIKRKEQFWDWKNYGKTEKFLFSKDLVELIDGLLVNDPKKRLTINEVKKSKWYQGPVFSDDLLKVGMKPKIVKKSLIFP